MRRSIFLIAFVIVGIVMVACQGMETAESTYDQVKNRGTIQIGVRNDNPPMSFVDGNGDWVGFDIDLAHALAAELGIRSTMARPESPSCRTVRSIFR